MGGAGRPPPDLRLRVPDGGNAAFRGSNQQRQGETTSRSRHMKHQGDAWTGGPHGDNYL
jgi:hypothetical protein